MAEADWYPKREARQFEPPPWEREQFESLQERFEEDARIEPEQVPAEPERAPAEEPEESSGDEATAPAPSPQAKPERAEPAPGVPQAELDAMLARLRAEEPKVDEHLKSVTVFASVIAMILGVSMLVWGLYATMTARGHMASLVGAVIVIGMGLVFGLAGLWAGWRATNEQGEK
ncbi:MAG TPA: hypothetical protein VGK50_04595 [Coriobacteriia bacterium]|jgi:hypothetical protein